MRITSHFSLLLAYLVLQVSAYQAVTDQCKIEEWLEKGETNTSSYETFNLILF